MLSPSKGKAKGETQWSSGWWDFYALLDQSPRPVAWSSTSTFFHAHPTQPLVTARHFSTSKQFNLQSPPPVLSSPDTYEPPTVISVSPAGEWLFAYFPSGEMDGVGCLWQRSAPLDVWGIREWWSIGRGAAIVAANWLGAPREWIVDDAGSPTRLPPRGPRTPISNPTLVLVTESRWVTIFYLRQYAPSFKMMSCPLTEPGFSEEGSMEHSTRPGTVKICTRAAIGLAYNEAAIIVATRSRVLPSAAKDNSMSPMELALPLSLEMPSSEPELPIDWDSWGEDQCIELCEVRLNFEGVGMTMSTVPLPSLHGTGLGLTNFTFVPVPPSPSGAVETFQETMYLAATFLDFGDYTSIPKSELALYGLSRKSEQGSGYSSDNRIWTCRHANTRSYPGSVLTYMTSSACGQSLDTFGLYVGILNTSGPLPRDKNQVKEVKIGVTQVLKLPTLTDHERWETGRIMSPIGSAGRDVPLNAVLTCNDSMVLCCSLSSFGPSQKISLHTAPKLLNTQSSTGFSSTTYAPSRLVTALLSGTSLSDLSHILAYPSVPLKDVGEALSRALIMAENGQAPSGLTWRALGLILETYKMRALRVNSQPEHEILQARWQTAFDMCSLASCNSAFADCKDGDAFDLDCVWQLVGLSTWIVTFVEKLFQECILASDLAGLSQGDQNDDDLFNSGPSSPMFELQSSSTMLHLVHPIALRNLHGAVDNVVRFKNTVGSLSASEENSHIAKAVLVDLIGCSGVDFDALEPLLSELLSEAKRLSVEETRRCLALCEPTNLMRTYILAAIRKVAHASVVNKTLLFIKPSDLVDGVSQQIFDGRKDWVKDVVSKGNFGGRRQFVECVRCGGKSEIGAAAAIMPGHSSFSWRAWEKMWTKHCICGGSWIMF